jgi:hypothetical protein
MVMANEFEKTIGKTFEGYEAAGVATLRFLYPSMRCVGTKGPMPVFVPAEKAPYDLGGYYHGSGLCIGCELKETRDREHSLPLVSPGKEGNGLQYHQLEELVQLHQEGGVAILVYNNGGEIGRLGGQALTQAKIGLDAANKSRNPAKGAKSIPWGRFQPVKLGHNAVPLWLPDDAEQWRKSA